MADDAAIAALRNALLYESRFRDDLMLNTSPTLEDVMYRATIFIEVEEEKVAMAKKYTLLKVLMSKDKPWDDHYEPRQHYNKNYQKKIKVERRLHIMSTMHNHNGHRTNTFGKTKCRIHNHTAIFTNDKVNTPLNAAIYKNSFSQSIRRAK